MTLLHIVAGLLAIASGTIALFSLKGLNLHRQSGMIIVYAMLVMSASGALMAIIRAQPFNVIAGTLTFYLVISAWRTVRRPSARSRAIDLAAMLAAVAIGIACVFLFAGTVLSGATGEPDGAALPMVVVFGSVALLSAVGDTRRLLACNMRANQRLARHVWRMCLALFIAVGSFFLGQSQVFPEGVRNSGLLALPALMVLALMVYYLARVLFTQWRPSV